MLAKPIYPAGRTTTMNTFAGFRVIFPKPSLAPDAKLTLHLAAFSIYRVFINGQFLAHGPARCAKYIHRVDELDLTPHLVAGKNILAIEVAGYNMNGYYLTDQPAFLRAQLLAGTRLLAATGLSGKGLLPFQAANLKHRVQKVQRFSFMRPAMEMYNLTPSSDAWRSNPRAPFTPVRVDILQPTRLLPRNVPYPLFDTRQFPTLSCSGKMARKTKNITPWQDRCLMKVGPEFSYKGFLKSQIPFVHSDALAHVETKKIRRVDLPLSPASSLKVSAADFHIWDLGRVLTGFIGLQVKVTRPTHLVGVFEEFAAKNTIGDVKPHRGGALNVISWKLAPGTYRLESLEPYALRFLKLFTFSGSAEISNVYLRQYAHPLAHGAQLVTSDPTVNALFSCARETFRQNVIDIPMDNPIRERAGWLCDSYFTARGEQYLTGQSLVEKNFLEHFALASHFEYIPKGMIPKCYPADFTTGRFNPSWAMWFIVQLDEHVARTGNRALADSLRPRVEGILKFFQPFVNSAGLLENLTGENFMEWSRANQLTKGLHYPTNMLYTRTLEAVARLYGDKTLPARAQKMRRAILRQSYNGSFFRDHALRNSAGKLVVADDTTEICQYYAFFFDVVSPKSHPKLWLNLVHKFGPQRRSTRAFPSVAHADIFIGVIVRLMLLSRFGLLEKLLADSRAYFADMIEQTGTYWEAFFNKMTGTQGFASIMAELLVHAATGISHIDPLHKTLRWSPPNTNLDWSTARLPVGSDSISITLRPNKKTGPTLHLPAGWSVK